MKNIRIALLAAIILIFTGTSGQTAKKASPPNIVLILSDDMGYETLSYNGATNYRTPNLDKLAGKSTVFTNCDAQPLCVPSRVKLITGQYNYRNYTSWDSFNLEFPALGQMMRDAGYRTGAFGKWHISRPAKELGFDEFSLSNTGSNELPYHEFFERFFYDCPLLEENGTYVAEYSPHRFNTRALQFIEDNKHRPFFLYYPMALAHNPFEPTPDSEDPGSTHWQKNFNDMVAYSDKLIGRVIQKLKQTGVYDNTIIIYTSDNGTKTLAHHMEDGKTIYGGKGTHTHDGVHVPLLIKHDGTHQKVDDLVDFTDFYPTLADLAGYNTSGISDKMDGVSLLPVLKQKVRDEKPYIFSTFFHLLSAYIRGKRYKLYYDGRLYDLKNDPRELRPYYGNNDISDTQSARKILKKQLSDLLENKSLSKYSTREKLRKKFGDYEVPPTDDFMLGGFIFDDLAYVPREESLTIDITPFLSKEPKEYRLRFSREHNSFNSGLTYGDISVSEIQLLKNGKLKATYKDSLRLTTRVDHDRLKRTGNPYISFLKNGDGKGIAIGEHAGTEGDTYQLRIRTTVSNPDNQWGDRVMLYVFLDEETSTIK
ncbi:sulfatase-like hydrolase/transferase [Ulvibacterium sp.]|uniref:sulfatase-like hydrolase/transferase n=1 Tax=Ulvibacterium sp. TaxID=2665914 RepID=UPI003BAC4A2E